MGNGLGLIGSLHPMQGSTAPPIATGLALDTWHLLSLTCYAAGLALGAHTC